MNDPTANSLTQDTSNRNCRILFDILEAKGVESVILSPGSRNAPLLIAAACRNFRRKVITDERTAAFVALGETIVLGRPTALVCTSGTALYNYAPAVAEAMYQGVPLIVLSADRPAEWIDQDDSQTLRQPYALQNIVKGSYDIPVQQEGVAAEWYVNRIINEAYNTAVTGIPGPVHVNIHLDNPLGNTIGYTPEHQRMFELIDNTDLPPHIYKTLAEELTDKRILVTVGFARPSDALNRCIKEFMRFPNVTVMCETLSNLHLDGNPYSIDTTLSYLSKNGREEIPRHLHPDVVISLGGALVSRMLKEFIRKCHPESHWTLGDTRASVDCFMVLTRHFEVSPAKFFKGITRNLHKREPSGDSNSFASDWQAARQAAQLSHDRFIDNTSGWSEMTAFHHIFSSLPKEYNVFLSNGTTVRYAQLFTTRLPHASFGNRGVSGIEGTSATALGCAFAYSGPTLLISGDMSFAYAPGIMGIRGIPRNFKIIVINNKGGGIFRFISSTRDCGMREELFCADPEIPVRKLAEAYGWHYMLADSRESMRNNFRDFLADSSNAIMEIIADGEQSADILRNYMDRRNL